MTSDTSRCGVGSGVQDVTGVKVGVEVAGSGVDVGVEVSGGSVGVGVGVAVLVGVPCRGWPMLNTRPRTSIEDGLARFVAWYREFHGVG